MTIMAVVARGRMTEEGGQRLAVDEQRKEKHDWPLYSFLSSPF